MEIQLTSKDKKRIEKSIRGKYAKVAVSPENLFKYPTGLAGLKTLNYDPEIIQALPVAVSASYCGVGNPFTLGQIGEGEAVLDIGCGAGVDTIVAAMMVGPRGTVTGIDLVPQMLAKARENTKMIGLRNVTFVETSAEKMPFPDADFDVVISNGVFNLIPDKLSALTEAIRVLKPGGRLMIADQILVGELPRDNQARIKSWFRWEGGAIPGMDFLALIKQAGFIDSELGGETGFNSSPVTKGVLLRATKPVISGHQERREPMQDSALNSSKASVEEMSLEDKKEHLLKRALELGAEKAKIIETDTVVVEEWVRWKCRYGCPLFEKDAYHPPIAPDTETMKKVIREYDQAILMNGPKGKALTEAVVKLEGEAYHMGYYKAFALTALSTGPSDSSASGGD